MDDVVRCVDDEKSGRGDERIRNESQDTDDDEDDPDDQTCGACVHDVRAS
jgi:hypothetical protein